MQIQTLATTKQRFYSSYPKIIPAPYKQCVQDMLAKHHFIRFNIKYEPTELSALGIFTMIDNILEVGNINHHEKEHISNAFVLAVNEDPENYKIIVENPIPIHGGQYNSFVALGIFKYLQILGDTSPRSMATFCQCMGYDIKVVSKDLQNFNNIIINLNLKKHHN